MFYIYQAYILVVILICELSQLLSGLSSKAKI